ncbi:hypothetical protein [Bacteroides sp. 224]|uniref:hypothetical protein n=1 Tax=Bacteroides sp. 224 TaxID=2302936 RepID=UPI0013D04E0B|nr:hypothetical protein [Bacteroides sp. 224]NDV64578.1 hypothetical protein [Bacteroides sp. 224]
MKRILFLSIVLIAAISSFSQNLEKMKKEQRDVLLVEIAKNAVKKYAPGYYREYGKPKIEKNIIDKQESKESGYKIGRISYKVIFPYDESIEFFYYGFSAAVYIWEDTGRAFVILVGNSGGRHLPEEKNTRAQEEEIEIIPYIKREPRQLIRD